MTRSGDTGGDMGPVDIRLRLSALWIAMLFIFVYVDLFSLYRPDVRADLENQKIFVFDINQTFLFGVTLYIIIPSLMVYLTLVMGRQLSRIVNMTAAAIYALTIVGGAVGEWNYFIVGSIVEALLLAVVVHHAWTWPQHATVDPTS
ncbi:MAG: hypothetical protein H0W82_05480 [Actinobacteria bacterium]|nr:hypothetical protein [Actinomycetota bacterium]